MTLPASGAISFNAINVELGVAGTTTANINQASYRTLAGVPSGTIALSNFYGKSNRAAISYTYSASTANASLNVTSIGGYSAGTSDITITVNAGIYLYSTGTGTPGLTLSGGSSGDTITLVNNGYIMGMGGAAGNARGPATSPTNGGTALQLGFATTVNNTNGSAYIGGGGGGGGYGATFSGGGGGGAGGGDGGRGEAQFTSVAGGAGGGIGATGSDGSQLTSSFGTKTNKTAAGGGGGGRIFPGSGGAGGTTTVNNANGKGGGSGGGASSLGGGGSNYSGGAGGSGSASGGNGGTNSRPGDPGAGGGGGWGASGGYGGQTLGASGGKAVNLNGYSITWTSGNTTRVYGSVS
jgi:hypothetical protein